MLGALLSPIGRWASAALAALAAVWVIYARGRADARAAAEKRSLEEALRRREVRDAVEADVAREPDAARRLRERWSRD